MALDAKHRGRLNALLYPARDIYVPHAQRVERALVAVTRASGDPAAISGRVREAVQRLDGVLNYHVSLRARERAVRLALGAEGRDVVQLAVRDDMTTVSIGIIAGLAGAVGLSRFISSLLCGVAPRDPATFATVALVLTSVALAAAVLPARAATRVDPMQTLRAD